MYDIEFVDPSIVNQAMLKDFPKDVDEDLTRFLVEQNFCKDILFPYNFR